MANWVEFDSWKTGMFNGVNTTDLDGDTIKMALVTVVNVPDVDVDDFWNDLSATEVSGTNYTSGGTALTTKTVNESGGTVTWDSDDITWTQSGSGFTDARYAILYKDTGTATTSPLIAYGDFSTDKGNVTGDFSVNMDAAGIFTLA